MKRCPECRRDYYDDSLLYCLDDGNALLEGPASGSRSSEFDGPQTAILHEPAPPSEAATRAQIHTTAAEPDPQRQADKPATHPAAPSRSRTIMFAAGAVVLVLALGGYLGYRSYYASGQLNSIAVLPFENRSGTPDADYLSDGLSESLIYRLSQLPGLKVSPTNATLRYKDSQASVATVAKELDVDAVMTGRLTQRGDDLSISVELTDARTGKLVWAEQYPRKMADLLATQREIAAAVTQKLQLKLSANEPGLTKQYTNDNEAYQLYLKGRFYWNKRTGASLKTAIEQFKAAADRDPNFALAYVGLADSYLVGLYSTRGTENEIVPIAKAYAARAMEIDPTLAEAHATLGLANVQLLEWAESEKNLKRAIEINPKYASAHHWYSRLLRSMGRFDEGLAEIEEAKADDPLSGVISNNVAECLYEKGDIPAAMAEAKRGIEISPMWTQYRTLAYCSLRLGQKEEALASAKKGTEMFDSPVTLKVVGYVQAVLGNRSEAESIARSLEGSYAKGSADGRDVAVVYAGLGENDKVFEWLEKDVLSRNISLTELLHEVPFTPLRTDPRFRDILRRAGLPQ